MGARLKELEVMFVDCQTTGAAPDKGSVLELAWCRTSAAEVDREDEQPVISSLLALPEGVALPRRVAGITGITAEELDEAPAAAEVLGRFTADCLTLGSAEAGGRLVAHFARFERAFLEDLHRRFGAGASPGPFLCTHELARRLLPDLPRLGLRALAGYYGHPLPEKQRAADHVRGTARIWAALLNELDGRPEGDSLDTLERFLTEPPPARAARKRYPLAEEKRRALPARPGIYRFLDRRGEPLYIGKASNLKTRVGSYFQSTRGKADHILTMLTQAHDVAHTVTATPLEAALLETDGIKEHDPPYNRALRAPAKSTWFFSTDWSSHATCLDPDHPHGPFPHPEPLAAVHGLHQLLASPEEATGTELELHFAEEPTAELTREAAALFLAAFPDADRSPARLISLGVVLARRADEKRAEALEEIEEEDNEEVDLEEPDEAWTAPRLVGAYRHVAALAGRMWVRSCWSKLLAESTLSWRPTGDGPRRLLVLDGARIVESRELGDDEGTVAPPGWRRDFVERGGRLDRTSYDRLRVLTAEIKRISKGGQEPCLVLSPGKTLAGEQLARLLEDA